VSSTFATPVASKWTVKFAAVTDCAPRSKGGGRPIPRMEPPRRSSRRRTGISTSSSVVNCYVYLSVCQKWTACSGNSHYQLAISEAVASGVSQRKIVEAVGVGQSTV
jgi:hypothetical protein